MQKTVLITGCSSGFGKLTAKKFHEKGWNVFGVMRVSRAVLPYMRKQKGGTIINVTSMAGYIGLALTSTYSASKFAVEGLTEAMALEYKPFNIKVKAVAPGAFGTNFIAATDNNLENGYDELKPHAQKLSAHFATLAEQMQKQGGKDADPQEVADIIYKCVTEDTPIHNVVGADAEMLLGMINSMPRQDFINQIETLLTPKE